MVPCSLLAPDVNVELRAAFIAALRNGTEVVVVPLPLIDAEVTYPAAFTLIATTTVPSLVGSS